MAQTAIETWHQLVKNADPSLLEDLLDKEVVFHSPVVHTPVVGKKIVELYLASAMQVLFNNTFTYTREIVSKNDAVLEFEVEIDGIYLNGVDLICWNDDQKITDFKVMIRPLKAVNLIHEKMQIMLKELSAR